MPRNFFSRMLRLGRKLFQKSHCTARRKALPFPRLEALEDRRLLAAGFGGLSFFQHVSPVTLVISIEQPAIVSQTSVNSSPSLVIGDQGLFSFLGNLNQGASSNGSQTAGVDNGDLANSVFNPASSTAANVLTPATSTAGSALHGTQPVVTTTTPGLQPNLPLALNLVPAATQVSAPLLQSAQTSAALSVGVNMASTMRTGATISTIANVGAAPGAGALPPVLSPSSDAPAPTDSMPITPPDMPDIAPTMPTVPPGAQPVGNVPNSLNLMPSNLSTPIPANPQSLPTISVTASQLATAVTTATQPADNGANKGVALDLTGLLFGSSAAVMSNATVVAEGQAAEVAAPVSGVERGRPELSLAAGTVGGGLFTGLESFVFADAAELSTMPAQAADVLPAPGEQDAAIAAVPTTGTGNTLIAVSDEVFTQVATTGRETTAAARELLTPSGDHWLRYIAPVFIAAGAYVGTRAAQRKKTNDRVPLVLGL